MGARATPAAQVADWKRTMPGLDDFVLWVNVSAGQFLRTDLAAA